MRPEQLGLVEVSPFFLLELLRLPVARRSGLWNYYMSQPPELADRIAWRFIVNEVLSKLET